MADPKQPKGADAFISEAYAMQNERELLDFYKTHADEYDNQMLAKLAYISPAVIADLLDQCLDDKTPAVLDVGCGTGLAGEHILERGFTTIDGLDFSADMIGVARGKGIYRNLYVADVNQPLNLADESYGAVICTGTFTHGHVGPEPLEEIFRILASGGVLACTVHQDLWVDRGFERTLGELEQTGRIERLYLEKGAYYKGAGPEGWFCVYCRP